MYLLSEPTFIPLLWFMQKLCANMLAKHKEFENQKGCFTHRWGLWWSQCVIHYLAPRLYILAANIFPPSSSLSLRTGTPTYFAVRSCIIINISASPLFFAINSIHLHLTHLLKFVLGFPTILRHFSSACILLRHSFTFLYICYILMTLGDLPWGRSLNKSPYQPGLMYMEYRSSSRQCNENTHTNCWGKWI